MLPIIALDPGTFQTGFVKWKDGAIEESGILDNEAIISMLRYQVNVSNALLAIEMIEARGMPVGIETFETCVWIGRFIECWSFDYRRIYRRDVKLHLCGTSKAKDANIRQALIDKVGPQGTKRTPGPTYGVKSHAWAALAVAVTAAETLISR